MILSLSWKNIWRKKVRSIVILTAISLGITAGIFNMGFYYGMIDQRTETVIHTEASHIQIHDSSYTSNPDPRFYMVNTGPVKDDIESLPEVKAASRRLVVSSMALTAETGAGVEIYGIDPEEEKMVTDIYRKLISGEYFSGTSSRPILIGEELGDKLEVGLGNKIILHLQTIEGTMTRSRFKVAGIYRTSNAQFNESHVFVEYSTLQSLMGMKSGTAHEMAILLQDNDQVDRVTGILSGKFSGLSVEPWFEIMPEVGLIEESMDVTMYFIMIIILFALCFGIINTMLMAVLERVKEFGMLKAIGMNKARVFFMVMTETVLIALTGGAAGLGFGYLVILITGYTGIDLSIYSQAWEELGYDSVIYPTIGVDNLVMITLLVMFTGILASVYPAFRAVRLNPAEALKADM